MVKTSSFIKRINVVVLLCMIFSMFGITSVYAGVENDDYSKIESFEGASVPSTWSIQGSGGTTALSTKHFKHGNKSLQWNWSNGSKLLDTNPVNLATSNASNGAMKLWIYNENPIANDPLTIRLGTLTDINSGVNPYSFKVNLNFKGWRTIWVKYVDEGVNKDVVLNKSQRLAKRLEVMQIIPPSTVPSGTLYFDNLEFIQSIAGDRAADYQMPKNGIYTGDDTYYYSQKAPTQPLPATISQNQINDFNTIVSRYDKEVYAIPSDAATRETYRISLPRIGRNIFDAAVNDISNAIGRYDDYNIQRHSDGTITGQALYADRDPHLPKVDAVTGLLAPLALDYKINGNAASKEKFFDVLDYVNDQGWAEGSTMGTQDHQELRSTGYYIGLYIMRDEIKNRSRALFDRELRTAFWYSKLGRTFDTSTYSETTADELHTMMVSQLLYILCMDNTPQKVQYMKGYLDKLNQALAIAPGYDGSIKADGTLFHHNGAYMNTYGPQAARGGTYLAYLLGRTQFAVTDSSFNNLKNALLTLELMSSKYVIPIGATGRVPGSVVPTVQNMVAYAYLAAAKNPVEQDMTSSFKRLWDTNATQALNKADGFLTLSDYQLITELVASNTPAKPDPVGFWAKPYGGFVINRTADRLVSVKGWSKYVFNAESYDYFNNSKLATLVTNVYGKYTSYGTLQILNNNLSLGLDASGINIEKGWDWARWPGSTAKHLTVDEIERTDHVFANETYLGGVSFNNQYGIFGMKLTDNEDTSFKANKTTFFFGDKLVCLGSDIVNSDTSHLTETVLFQSWMPNDSMPFWYNGTSITSSTYSNVVQDTSKIWMVDPYGNGYVIPNPKGTIINRGVQNSKNSAGTTNTSGNYTTAYINHGAAPQAAGYEYAIKLGAGTSGTEAFASKL